MLTEILLDCGYRDVWVLEQIDEDILEEAVEELKEEGWEINFPNLYYMCARIALQRANIPEDEAEIDCNYICAHIYVTGKTAKQAQKRAEKLEEMGFSVYY